MTSKPQTVEQPTARQIINAGPWGVQPEVYGQSCQLCELPIWSMNTAYVREGDDLSPALYRHRQCHEDAVRFIP